RGAGDRRDRGAARARPSDSDRCDRRPELREGGSQSEARGARRCCGPDPPRAARARLPRRIGLMARQPGTGISFPPQGRRLSTQASLAAGLESLGYSHLWTSEAGARDGLVPLAVASQWAPTIRLGVAILPVQTRGPAVLAMSAAALAEVAPGRCVIGL